MRTRSSGCHRREHGCHTHVLASMPVAVGWRGDARRQRPHASPVRLVCRPVKAPHQGSVRGLVVLSLALTLGLTSLVGPARPAKAAVPMLEPPFDASYEALELGSVPGLPPSYGGLTLAAGDEDTLLIGGDANSESGALYAIDVVRDADGHITGFSGTATRVIDAAFNDGGVGYGPGGVLFLARWPANALGQTKPGSTTTDKVIDMYTFGVDRSLSAFAFVPDGFPGAGQLKLVTYGAGSWHTADTAPDGDGTFDLIDVTPVPESALTGGPEGMVFVPPGSPGFLEPSILISEFDAGSVAAYELDANGDPIVATRRTFISGLSGAEGAYIDPVTGDFLFSTFGGGDRVVVVRGFASPAPNNAPARPVPGSVQVVSESGMVAPAADAAIEIVLDTSGSMRQQIEPGRTRAEVAKSAMTELVTNQLPAGALVALRTFGDTPDSCDTNLAVPLQPLDPGAMASTIDQLPVVNLVRTPIAASLEAVASDLGEAPGPKIVVLVTDGEETCDGDPAAAIGGLVDQGFDVHVNIVGFALNDDALRATFQEWARLGQGSYFDATNAEQLGAAIAAAVQAPFEVDRKSVV